MAGSPSQSNHRTRKLTLKAKISMTETSSAEIEAIARPPKVVEAVTHRLRQSILNGTFAEGEPLRLEDLAQALEVSHMPVRGALISLAHEGLVVDLGRRGYRAKPLTDTDVSDIYHLHGYLAGRLAERAAEVVTDDDVVRLRGVHREFEALSRRAKSKDRDVRLRELNNRFHREINLIPKGDLLRHFLRTTVQFLRDDSYETLPDRIDMSLTDHPLIIDALARRDGAAASRLVETHIALGARRP